ncbi:uveal autoantigen with coiled-coil domains and ankyrin repeats protein-like isoform X1 [Oscarella lobularis]|uniref:uveal autoantigen with coiled-coil domains and ankyrin repeats protein-like isoform X1 n=1 Tax=Oscarella lobularis TaxID=121494 RepID=UPI0033138836
MQGELKSTKELLEQKMNEAGQEKEAWIAERRRLVKDVLTKEVELHELHLQLEAKPQAGESLSLVMSDVSKMMRLEAENEQMQKELEDLKDVKRHFKNADIIASTLQEKESEYIREIGELNYRLKTASQTIESLEHATPRSSNCFEKRRILPSNYTGGGATQRKRGGRSIARKSFKAERVAS